MAVAVMVDEAQLPATFTVPEMTDERFREICEEYDGYPVEYTSDGEVVVMPPTDWETSSRNLAISVQLGLFALQRRGLRGTDSSGCFTLPNGARRAPDGALITRARLRSERHCPEFVIELLSPSDWPKRTAAKMREWIENGAELGWMINPKTRTVTIFRPGREPEVRQGIDEIAGEGIAEGFVLDLRPVWEEL